MKETPRITYISDHERYSSRLQPIARSSPRWTSVRDGLVFILFGLVTGWIASFLIPWTHILEAFIEMLGICFFFTSSIFFILGFSMITRKDFK
jgi:hypothetical protein